MYCYSVFNYDTSVPVLYIHYFKTCHLPDQIKKFLFDGVNTRFSKNITKMTQFNIGISYKVGVSGTA